MIRRLPNQSRQGVTDTVGRAAPSAPQQWQCSSGTRSSTTTSQRFCRSVLLVNIGHPGENARREQLPRLEHSEVLRWALDPARVPFSVALTCGSGLGLRVARDVAEALSGLCDEG